MKRILFVALLLFSLSNVYSQDRPVFYWNLGNININFNVVESKWALDLNFAEFNWIFNNGIFLGVTMLKTFYNFYDGYKPWYSLFPLEVGYQLNLTNNEILKLRFYNRLEWQYKNFNSFTSSESGIYDAVGVKLIVGTDHDSLRYNCNFVTLFTEYTTKKEFRMGITVDLFICAVFLGGILLEAL